MIRVEDSCSYSKDTIQCGIIHSKKNERNEREGLASHDEAKHPILSVERMALPHEHMRTMRQELNQKLIDARDKRIVHLHAHHPQARSFLMNNQTLLTRTPLWLEDPKAAGPPTSVPPNLTTEEALPYLELRNEAKVNPGIRQPGKDPLSIYSCHC